MDRLDTLRARALDRAERHFKTAFVLAALVEGAFLVALILLAYFSDPTHLLILVATGMVYSVLGIGLVTLGIHVNRVGFRVLRAVAQAAASEP